MGYYDTHAAEYAASTFGTDMKPVYDRFLPHVPAGGSILDVGSGSGRDACAFEAMGYAVTALEPSEGLCTEIRKHFHGEVVCSDILSYTPDTRFDAIWACASLLHLPEDNLKAFFRDIGIYLAPGGTFYASGKSGIETGCDSNGRFFLNFTEDLLRELLAESGDLELSDLWYSEDLTGRCGFRWMNFTLKRKLM